QSLGPPFGININAASRFDGRGTLERNEPISVIRLQVCKAHYHWPWLSRAGAFFFRHLGILVPQPTEAATARGAGFRPCTDAAGADLMRRGPLVATLISTAPTYTLAINPACRDLG